VVGSIVFSCCWASPAQSSRVWVPRDPWAKASGRFEKKKTVVSLHRSEELLILELGCAFSPDTAAWWTSRICVNTDRSGTVHTYIDRRHCKHYWTTSGLGRSHSFVYRGWHPPPPPSNRQVSNYTSSKDLPVIQLGVKPLQGHQNWLSVVYSAPCNISRVKI
jgi:hypothetical protein